MATIIGTILATKEYLAASLAWKWVHLGVGSLEDTILSHWDDTIMHAVFGTEIIHALSPLNRLKH